VSIGLACFPEDGRTLDALDTRADRALYRAKQEGRNRVVRYKPG
jgi:diguanylate cyclase (GGDEF)-like protein